MMDYETAETLVGKDPELFLIPQYNLETLEKKIGQQAKKALKYGFPEPTMTLIEKWTEKDFRGKAKDQVCPIRVNGKPSNYYAELCQWAIVRITGEAPHIEGFQLIGSIEKLKTEDKKGTEVFYSVPGEVIPETFRGRFMCDHCGTKKAGRSARKITYVVLEEDTGVYKQVGSKCVRDYLGGIDPKTLANYQKTINVVMRSIDDMGEYSHDYWEIDTKDYLTAVAVCIRIGGWMPKWKAEEDGVHSTANIALRLFDPPETMTKSEWKRWNPTDADQKLAADALDWARRALKPMSDYERNMNAASKSIALTRRSLGIVASIVSAYTRENAQSLASKTPTNTANGFLGKEGDKVSVRVHVKAHRSGQSGYGAWTLHIMDEVDDDDNPTGRSVKWFANENRDNIQEGTIVTISAKVKKQNSYNGNKETIVNYVKVLKNGRK